MGGLLYLMDHRSIDYRSMNHVIFMSNCNQDNATTGYWLLFFELHITNDLQLQWLVILFLPSGSKPVVSQDLTTIFLLWEWEIFPLQKGKQQHVILHCSINELGRHSARLHTPSSIHEPAFTIQQQLTQENSYINTGPIFALN